MKTIINPRYKDNLVSISKADGSQQVDIPIDEFEDFMFSARRIEDNVRKYKYRHLKMR